MENWILENMKDCMIYGYSFKWFFNHRKEDYLKLHTEEELKTAWKNLWNIMGSDF